MRRAIVFLGGVLAVAGGMGCEQSSGSKDDASVPTTAPAEPEVRDLTVVPDLVGRDDKMPTTRGVAVAGGTIMVDGKPVPLPPATLTLAKDGTATLTADRQDKIDEPANSLFLTMTPKTDRKKPWTHAVWKYQISSSEEETVDGIYVGGPDHVLRPVELDVEIVRVGGTCTVNVRGKFVPSDADDPMTAAAFEASASLPVTVVAE